MKKLFKILLLSVVAVLCFSFLFACDTASTTKDKGLKFSLKIDQDNSKHYVVTGFIGDGETELIIPSEKEGIPVTEIKGKVFSGNDTIVALTVPNSVTHIHEGAFAEMEKLQTLNVPFIGEYANADAYYNETGDATDKATEKARTFGYFFGSESYKFATKVTQTFGEGNAFDYYMPISLKTVNITSAVNVPMYAFYGNTVIEKVILSNNTVKIGDNAFNGATSLKDINVPASVKYIGERAFASTTSLSSVVFGNVTGLAIYDYAFSKSGIKTLNLVNGVNYIGTRCFADSAIKEIILNVEDISDYAFYNCSALIGVTANGVKKIGNFAFYGCKKLVKFNSNEEIINLTGVEKVGALAFSNLSDKTYSVITAIDVSGAFYGVNYNVI